MSIIKLILKTWKKTLYGIKFNQTKCLILQVIIIINDILVIIYSILVCSHVAMKNISFMKLYKTRNSV